MCPTIRNMANMLMAMANTTRLTTLTHLSTHKYHHNHLSSFTYIGDDSAIDWRNLCAPADLPLGNNPSFFSFEWDLGLDNEDHGDKKNKPSHLTFAPSIWKQAASIQKIQKIVASLDLGTILEFRTVVIEWKQYCSPRTMVIPIETDRYRCCTIQFDYLCSILESIIDEV